MWLCGCVGKSALTAPNSQQYCPTSSMAGDRAASRLRGSLPLVMNLLGGHLQPIEYCLDPKPAGRPVIILPAAMWNAQPAPNGSGCMAWVAWVPEGEIGGELFYAPAEADPGLL